MGAGDAEGTLKRREIWLWEGCKRPYKSKMCCDNLARAQGTFAEDALGMGCSGRQQPQELGLV